MRQRSKLEAREGCAMWRTCCCQRRCAICGLTEFEVVAEGYEEVRNQIPELMDWVLEVLEQVTCSRLCRLLPCWRIRLR